MGTLFASLIVLSAHCDVACNMRGYGAISGYFDKTKKKCICLVEEDYELICHRPLYKIFGDSDNVGVELKWGE